MGFHCENSYLANRIGDPFTLPDHTRIYRIINPFLKLLAAYLPGEEIVLMAMAVEIDMYNEIGVIPMHTLVKTLTSVKMISVFPHFCYISSTLSSLRPNGLLPGR